MSRFLKLKLLFLPIFLVLTLAVSFSPWFLEMLATPKEQVPTGINRWSGDYFAYVSYVEQGIRGNAGTMLLSTTRPQKPLLMFLVYNITGLLGRVFGFDAILSYHLSQFFLGAGFILTCFFFYYFVFGNFWQSAACLFLTFWVGSFPKITSLSSFSFERPLSWLQEANLLGRPTSPPHYLLGFILFLLFAIYFLKYLEKNTGDSSEEMAGGGLAFGEQQGTGDSRRELARGGLAAFSIWRATGDPRRGTPVDRPQDFARLPEAIRNTDAREGRGRRTGENAGQDPSPNIFRTLLQFLSAIFIFFLFFSLILIVNPVNLYVLAGTLVIFFILQFLQKKLTIKTILTFLLATLLFLPVFLYYQRQLTAFPWGPLSNTLKFYLIKSPAIPLLDLFLMLGPILPLGILGLFFFARKSLVSEHFFFLTSFAHRLKTPPRCPKDSSDGGGIANNFTSEECFRRTVRGGYQKSAKLVFLLSWLACQSILFFIADPLGIDPARFLQGLYYIPLSVFSTVAIYELAKIFKKKILVITYYLLLILLYTSTIPVTFLSYRELLFAFTDFKSFSTLTFPTKKQVEAYRFLEKATPSGTGVLAMYEASAVLPIFSANATEINFVTNEEKAKFFSGQMKKEAAYQFLKDHNFQYVYYGYQEKYFGDISSYPFLKLLFENPEAKIYQFFPQTPQIPQNPQIPLFFRHQEKLFAKNNLKRPDS